MARTPKTLPDGTPLLTTPLGTRIKRAWQLYILVLPSVIWLAIFAYWPMYGVQIAFRNYTATKGITGSDWVGLAHFERFVMSAQFGMLLWNTIALSLYELIAAFPVPIILALALNAVRQKYFAKYVQLITYAPNFISAVVVVGIMVMLLDPRTGIVNIALHAMGLPGPDFLNDAGWFRHLYVWSGVWQSAGFSAIIYLAALSSVAPELHEAAQVDGANRLRRIFHVDLPAIWPIATILLILQVGQILSVGFEKVLLMQTDLNRSVSEVIDTYVYRVGLMAQLPQYSYATAIGLFKSIVGMLLLLLVNWFAKRTSNNGLF